MKVKCPWCKDNAEIAIDCSCIKCKKCEKEWDFDEYIKLAAKDDPATCELLANYDDNIEGESDDLTEWD